MLDDNRIANRRNVRIPAELRMSGHGKVSISVSDLSNSGFRMFCLTQIKDEALLFLTLPGLAPLEAKVAWKSKDEYGCSFIQPLHPAVFDHIVKLHPTLA